MRETHLATIREACIKANPEVAELKAFECPDGEHEDTYLYRPIRLADVLEAARVARGGMWARYNGVMTLDQWVADLLPMWDLQKDDLTEQSDECLSFLADLLSN